MEMNFSNLSNADLDKIALTGNQVERIFGSNQIFLSGIGEVLKDCDNRGNSWSSFFDTNFPVVMWALRNSYSTRMRERLFGINGLCNVFEEDGKYMLSTPGAQVNSLPAVEGAAEECCWAPFEYDKCSGKAPIALLCLKDCEDILRTLISDRIKVGSGALDPLAREGDVLKKVKENNAKYSMVFFTLYTAMLGLGVDTAVGNIIKPFNGLASIMESPIVFRPSAGANGILNAFKSVGCRLKYTREAGDDVIFAIHPLGYQSLLDAVSYGQFNTLPSGWRRTDDDKLFYQGVPVIEDTHMPIDFDTNTCEAWMLNGSNIGILFGTNPFDMEDKFIRKTYTEKTLSNNCGSDCTYYYNFGTAATNNAKKLAVITDIPINNNCLKGVEDLHDVVYPQTIAPKTTTTPVE